MHPDYPTASSDAAVVTGSPTFSPAPEEMDPFPLRKLYLLTSPPSSYYQLDAGNDHLLKCGKGTLLHIPRNAFVYASSGEAASQTIQLEVKEVYHPSEYLHSNLPTVSNGQQLIAGGAVYIDATAAGRRLELARDKAIYVEFAQQEGTESEDMQLYHGRHNEKGEINLAHSGAKVTKLIPMPMENLYLDEFWCDCDGEKYWNLLLNQLNLSPKYKGSWTCTREFRQRLRVLRDMDYYEAGLATYLDNIDKELWKVDQMVAEKLVEDGEGRISQDAEIETFHRFARQMLTFAETYQDFGLDLTKPDARRQLLYRSVSREETERLIRIARLRKVFVEDLEENIIPGYNGKIKFVQGLRKGKLQRAGSQLIAGYLIHELGWNSLNKVANNEFARHRNHEIKVRLIGHVAYESMRAFIAFTEIQSIMPGKPTPGQMYRFAHVPEDMTGWIVVIGFKNEMPYLGLLRLPKVDGDKIVQVGMEETRFDAYFSALSVLD
jgi:hypothetical protein